MTLDGFFEGTKKWDLDFHEYVWGDELEKLSLDQLAGADALVFGRVTYEGMAAHWTKATGPIADAMNAIPKVVCSRTLATADWNNTRVVRDAGGEIATLRSEAGRDLYVFGSADLSATLMRRDLIDEYRLCVAPVVLGAGTPLFKPGIDRKRMTLREARPLKTGGALLFYEPVRA